MHAAPERLRARQFGFAAHLRDPEGSPAPPDVAAERIAVYRDLFFNNVSSLLAANFPVIRSLHDESQWTARVRTFYRDHRAQTPLFTEIGREFIRHLETRREQGADDPPFLAELANHEWIELALDLDEHDLADVPHDPHGELLDGVPVVSPLTRLSAYRFPVHRIGPDFQPTMAVDSPTLILAVRTREDRVQFHEVDALTALLLERLTINAGDSGRECLRQLVSELGRGDEPALLASGAAILARLRERHALLGTRPA